MNRQPLEWRIPEAPAFQGLITPKKNREPAWETRESEAPTHTHTQTYTIRPTQSQKPQ